jgi:hypothetical protein
MATVIAKNIFSAFEECTIQQSESSTDLNELTSTSPSKFSLKNPSTSLMNSFFEAYERFYMPQIASSDSLASMVSSAALSSLESAHSSCSNFDEIPPDVNVPMKLYLALEKLTVNMQGTSRLPSATKQQDAFTTEELTLVQRFFVALEEFMQLNNGEESENSFRKFC